MKWASIKGFTNYEISNCGNVRNVLTGRTLKNVKTKTGYLQVTLRCEGESTNIRIHRLVADHFLPRKPTSNCVNHLDGDKGNNHFSNLEWTSSYLNNRHAIENGLINTKGENHWNSKLTETEVKVLREMVANGVRQKDIAEKLGCAVSTVSLINSGKIWGHIKEVAR
ncbi:NUMOD4 domain-containing protein [Bacillus cereus group sp. TH153LC]|uniref:NUMOD4 domain-containing protein n=1 Tax=Bacillus cereus group sp. TH153LC TaxID=3018059 RepID=UPI0022E786FD|nr:NUMOD4 domain-containing protein [Bacillus cereus group sp. TH153LC]MDA1658841.1 NUMOD4 domain-containing protein [Bacillus cereus group sp. TH153LC]